MDKLERPHCNVRVDGDQKWGNHPKMIEHFRLVNDSDLSRSIDVEVS